MQTLLKAAVVYGSVLLALVLVTFPAGVPRSVGVLQPILFLVLVSNSRAWARFWLNRGAQTRSSPSPADLRCRLGRRADGGCNCQRWRIRAARVSSMTMPPRLVVTSTAFPCLAGTTSRKLSNGSACRTFCSRCRRRRGSGGTRSSRDCEPCRCTSARCRAWRTSPPGELSISDFRELDLEDLLGRDPVPPNSALLARDLAGKVVLVTGAGGSIGSELCRQILAEHPAKLSARRAQ